MLDTIDRLDRVLDHVGVVELLSVVAKIDDSVIELLELVTDEGEAGFGLLSAGLVLVEITLLELSGVDFKVLFELLDHVRGLLLLTLDERGDFLTNVLG